MAATATKLYTAEEYARLSDDITGEWSELVRGVIVPKYEAAPGEENGMAGPGFRHGKVQVRVAARLLAYCDEENRCQVVTETGVVTERDPDTVRGPDISLYNADRLPLNKVVIGYPDLPADLCIEVASPSNSLRKLLAKAEEYILSGVKAVWIADPETKTLRIVDGKSQERVLDAQDIIQDFELLPGFSCKVAEFFA